MQSLITKQSLCRVRRLQSARQKQMRCAMWYAYCSEQSIHISNCFRRSMTQQRLCSVFVLETWTLQLQKHIMVKNLWWNMKPMAQGIMLRVADWSDHVGSLFVWWKKHWTCNPRSSKIIIIIIIIYIYCFFKEWFVIFWLFNKYDS